jgi:hypothetical protein
MSVRPIAAALLVVAALGLAACGGDETEANAGRQDRPDDEELRQAQVKFAECMRKEGVDMPDPEAGGKQTFKVGGDSGISPEEFEAASKACEKYRKDIRPQLSEEEQAEFKQKALDYARCMRDHGIDMPDPQFSEGGGGQFRIGGPGFDPEDSEFKAAEEACGDLMEKRP